MKKWIPALVLALPLAAAAAPIAPRTQAEIDHLFDYISQSNCRFNRNGSWHGMGEARDHVHMKYQSLARRGEIDSAEAFIDRAASRSSLTGKEYRVECPGSAEVSSSAWLKDELARFRGKST
jgi:hypothetical protein